MAALGVAETKMGKVEHKIAKHIPVADKTPGTEDIVAEAKTGDHGPTLTERAPFGVVGAITPLTNPLETVICNSMGMIAAGNGVVFNPIPARSLPPTTRSIWSTVPYTPRAVRKCWSLPVKKPTLDTADVMYKHPAIRLLVCTGARRGQGGAVLRKEGDRRRCGQPCPSSWTIPLIIEKAAKDIIDGCSSDNNLPCIAEKEVFVFENVADRPIRECSGTVASCSPVSRRMRWRRSSWSRRPARTARSRIWSTATASVRDCSVIWRRSGCTSVPRSGAPLPRSRLSIPSFEPS